MRVVDAQGNHWGTVYNEEMFNNLRLVPIDCEVTVLGVPMTPQLDERGERVMVMDPAHAHKLVTMPGIATPPPDGEGLFGADS